MGGDRAGIFWTKATHLDSRDKKIAVPSASHLFVKSTRHVSRAKTSGEDFKL